MFVKCKSCNSKEKKIAERLLAGDYIYSPIKYRFRFTVRVFGWIQKAKMMFLKLLYIRKMRKGCASEQDQIRATDPAPQFRVFQVSVG